MNKYLKKYLFNERGGGTKTQVVSAPPQPPAPSASESAENIYQARLKYDPLIAQKEFELQQQFMPQQAALEYALYNQYYPQLAQTQQELQQQLYPQQSQILEAGAGRALERLSSPFGYTPEEEQSLEGIRQRQREQLIRQVRERANLGGGLFGGRAIEQERQGLTELEQAFGAEDINRRLQGGYQAQQAALPYMQILYPQIGATQPQFQPFQYQSAVPDPNNLYNAMFQAGRRDYGIIPGQPSPLWGLAGQIGGGLAGGWAMGRASRG